MTVARTGGSVPEAQERGGGMRQDAWSGLSRVAHGSHIMQDRVEAGQTAGARLRSPKTPGDQARQRGLGGHVKGRKCGLLE